MSDHTASSSGSVKASIDGPIGYITFDHQERRNALTKTMWRQIPGLCQQLDEDNSVKVVVLAGAGADSFVAGADISEFTNEFRPGSDAYNEMVGDAYEAVASISKPTIAQVHGFCVGGGLAIAANTDIRICSTDAQFGLPPVRLGVGYSPEGIGQLVGLIGPGAVNEMVLTASLLDSVTASRWGLVNHVVEPAELASFVTEMANTMSQRAPLSQYAAKLAVKACVSRTPEAMAQAKAAAAVCLDSADYAEGIAAFNDKRRPNFVGR